MTKTQAVVLVVCVVIIFAVITIFGILYKGDNREGKNSGTLFSDSKTEPLGDTDTIAISSISDSIVLTAVDGTDLTFVLEMKTTSPNRPSLSVIRSGRTVSADVVYPAVGPMLYSGVLKVGIPSSWNGSLKVTSTSGDISVPDMTLRDFMVHNTSGDLTLAVITADTIDVRTVSGEMIASGLSAKTVQLFSISGSFSVMKISGEINASTVSGDIRLAVQPIGHNVTVTSTSGDVHLKVPAAIEGEFALKSLSGDLDLDLGDLTYSSKTEHELTAKKGTGTISIVVSTTSGDIEVGPNGE